MALIRCPDCEREVSSRAVACPQCAYPIQKLTNLVDAAMQNDVDMVRDLVRTGQDPNEPNEGGLTPLMATCQQGNLSAAKLLVSAGADVNHQDQSGSTPLMETALLGYDRIARFLLDNGADPSIKNGDGETARDLAIKEEQQDLVALLPDDLQHSVEKEEQQDQPLKGKKRRTPSGPPPVPSDVIQFQPEQKESENAERKSSTTPVEPPPLPEDHSPSKTPVRFVDDLAPVTEDEKYAGPGLICKTCRGQIAPDEIWCAHCKAPIIRRYCGGCHELIPDNAAQCPYCSSSKVNRFRYIRHLEQIVGGAAVLGVLLFVLGVYNPQDSSSYAKKLAQQRSEQQEQKIIAAEETSKKQTQQRRTNATKPRSSATPALVRVVPREAGASEVVPAEGNAESIRIPTVERIEATPEPSENADDQTADSSRAAGQAVAEREKPDMTEQKEEQSVLDSIRDKDRDAPEPVHTAAKLNREGFRLMKNGRYAEAIPVLAQAVRSFPPGQKNLTYAYALYNLGRSLRLVGRADLAVPILEERMKFADQRHIVARELEQARAEVNGPQEFNNVRYR